MAIYLAWVMIEVSVEAEDELEAEKSLIDMKIGSAAVWRKSFDIRKISDGKIRYGNH